MTKTANPPEPTVESIVFPQGIAIKNGDTLTIESDLSPGAVPRVTYTTIEGITTHIPAPADPADAPSEENK